LEEEVLSIDDFIRCCELRVRLGAVICTVAEHEAVPRGPWSVYASLAGFEAPLSWRPE
jgi:hypothetical protein